MLTMLKKLLFSAICLSFLSCDEFYTKLPETEKTHNKYAVVTDTIEEEIPCIPYRTDNLNVYTERPLENPIYVFGNNVIVIESLNKKNIIDVQTEMDFHKTIQLCISQYRFTYWCADTVEIKPMNVTLTHKRVYTIE